MRYHKDVFYPQGADDKIDALCYRLNAMNWGYTAHCLNNARLRIMNLEQLLYFIKNDLKLAGDDIFEFYTDDRGNIEKLCFRIEFSKVYDIILVISSQKEIITIYINEKNDNHETLKRGLYAKT